MNVVKFSGGLGNQLFQYAFGKVLVSYGKKVAYHNSDYNNAAELKKQWPRLYRMDKFHTDITLSPLLRQGNIKDRIFDFVGRKYIPPKEGDYNYLGYWQCADYYYDVRDDMKKAFTLKEEYETDEYKKWRDKITSEPSVAMHVRRGDYMELNRRGRPRNWELPKAYYFKAVSMAPKGSLFIFSDEIDWCKKVFKPEYFSRELYFVHLEDYLDFSLLRHAQHLIISSSTFSWWAAFLKDSGEVLCTDTWLNIPERQLLMYVKGWTEVSC